MDDKRYLIVNADDFGLSAGVNRGIIRAYEEGIVTSASLMVRWPAAAEAALYARQHPDFSIGLHVDLGEWIFRDDAWVQLYEVVANKDIAAVEQEVARQLGVFRDLMQRNPSHLDSHQHVHLEEPSRSILVRLAEELRVPLRHFSDQVRYCKDFYGHNRKGLPFPEGISIDRLLGILDQLSPGYTELGCHPGDDDGLDSTYAAERQQELRILCDARASKAICDREIELHTFWALSRNPHQ